MHQGKAEQAAPGRACSAQATFARVERLLKPLGITRVANITGLDCVGIPVVSVARPNSRSVAVSMGKGVTVALARTSGVMEAIELHHAENITCPLVLASWNQLRFTHKTVEPSTLPRSSAGRFAPDRKLLWIAGTDLLKQEDCLVPYESVHTDFTLPLPSDAGCFLMSSNGLASGNTLQEAVCHGLCEVIERDADTLFSLLPAQAREQRRLDLATIGDPQCIELLRCFEAARVRVAVWDMTSDVQVPAFRAIALDDEFDPARPLGPSLGRGCHPSRELALVRALTEAAQSRLTVISGARDDLAASRFSEQEHIAERAVLERESTIGKRHFDATPSIESPSASPPLSPLLHELARRGLQRVVVVDLSQEQLAVPVARVIVPGLEGPRAAPTWVPGARALRAAEAAA